MKTLTQSELEKTVAKGEITDIEGRKGFVNITVDFGNDLVKSIAIKSDDEKDTKAQAVEIIANEPEGIRGFKLKAEK